MQHRLPRAEHPDPDARGAHDAAGRRTRAPRRSSSTCSHPPGRTIWAHNGFRPTLPSVAKADAASVFPHKYAAKTDDHRVARGMANGDAQVLLAERDHHQDRSRRMAIPADALTTASKAPPVPRSRRRFRVRPLSTAGDRRRCDAARRVPLGHRPHPDRRALTAHGLGFSIHTHGPGLAFWDWSVQTDFAGFWTDVTQPGALQAIWLSLWLSLSRRRRQRRRGRRDRVGPRARRVPRQARRRGRHRPALRAPDDRRGRRLPLPLRRPRARCTSTSSRRWTGLFVALLFVTLPFSVRAVQPVLESLDGQAEAAASSLGAAAFGPSARSCCPRCCPRCSSGFGLAFARAVGEFGSHHRSSPAGSRARRPRRCSSTTSCRAPRRPRCRPPRSPSRCSSSASCSSSSSSALCSAPLARDG